MITQKEIKKQMQQGEWITTERLVSCTNAQIGIKKYPDEIFGWVGIADVCCKDWKDKADIDRMDVNAEAITTAVNNTYGKGINPEAVEGLLEALKTVKTVIFNNGQKTAKLDHLAIHHVIYQAIKKAEL